MVTFKIRRQILGSPGRNRSTAVLGKAAEFYHLGAAQLEKAIAAFQTFLVS